MLDYQRLNELAYARSFDYANGAPFPHIHLDHFLPDALVTDIAQAIPTPDAKNKLDFYYSQGYEEKWALSDDLLLPGAIRNLIHEFNSGPFIRFLETLTGIPHLLPDPHLHGAGVHLVKRGGLLQVHSDFNWSEKLAAHRRVNMFIYLMPDWQESWGGALELWDKTCKQKVVEYAPLFNRLIVFTARSDTFHGHPHPLTCPEGIYRKSIAMYYYTSSRPEEEAAAPHNTIFKGLHI